MNRRSAITVAAALALPVLPDMEGIDMDHRPVFIPVTRSPFPEGDLDTLNAKLFETHLGRVWVYDNRDNLPTSYEEIDGLPFNYREALFEVLPVATAVELVLERMQRCADADPYLTDEKRAVLAGAPLDLTAEWAEASLDEREAKWPDGGFWNRTRRVFTSEEWHRVFGQGLNVDLWLYMRHLGIREAAQAVGW